MEKKSFWSKREGLVTLVLFSVVGIACLGFIDKIISLMLRIATNTFLLIGTLVLIAGLLYVITDKRVHAFVSTLWTNIIRKSLGWAIEMDPIGILKTKIQEAFEECQKILDEIKTFSTEIGKVENRINTNIKVTKERFDKADYLLRNGEKEMAENESAYAARLITMNNEKLIPLKEEMDRSVVFLEKLRKNLYVKTERTKNEVELQEIEFNAMKSGRNAMNSALRAFNGNPDKRMLYEMTAEHLDNEIGKMMGEIKMGVRMTQDFMKESDLENGQYSEKGLQMLKEYQSKGISGMTAKQNIQISSQQQTKLENSNNNSNTHNLLNL
jgi:hypothetical protein